MSERIDLRTWRTEPGFPGGEGRPRQRSPWAPATDISETSGQLLLEVELPGVERKDIELTVAGRRLVLKGVRGPPGMEGRPLVSERQSGPFALELVLPPECVEEPEADYREGVLTIRFAKSGGLEGVVTDLQPGRLSEGEREPWPPIDILDTGHGLLLLVDLPGVPQEAIEVLFEERLLTLRGRWEPKAAGRRYLQAERHAGAFSRSVFLPGEVAGERINASYNDGVLSVALPGISIPDLQQPEAAPETLQHLRGELEALRAQHQALRNEVDGFWLALGCGLRLVQLPLHQHLPVELSLRGDEPAVQQQVMAAVRGFVDFAGFEVWRDDPPERSPFLKRWQVRTRRKESQLEFQQRLLRMQEALELVRRGAMQAQEPRPEDFQDAERQRLLGEAARAWAEAIFTLAQALRAARAGASVLLGALSLQKQEPAQEGVSVVLRTLDEEELVSRLRNWPAAV